MATVGSMPGDHHALARHGLGPVSSGIDTLGIAVKNLDHALGQKLGLKTGQGVVISRITGTIAMQAGLQVGDVILMVNQHKVSSLKSFRKAARLVKPGDMLLLLVRRGNETNFISLSIPLHKSKP